MYSSRSLRSIQMVLFTLICVLGNVSLPHALDHADIVDPQSLTLAKLHQQIRRDVPRSPVPPLELARLIQSVAFDYHLDPHVLLGLVRTESSYNPQARSHVGALGLVQMMPAMIRHYGMTPTTFLACLRCQLELGAKHLTYLLHRFDGRQDLALLSYHGSLTPSQARYVLRIHRAAQRSAQSIEFHSLTLPTFQKPTPRPAHAEVHPN